MNEESPFAADSIEADLIFDYQKSREEPGFAQKIIQEVSGCQEDDRLLVALMQMDQHSFLGKRDKKLEALNLI